MNDQENVEYDVKKCIDQITDLMIAKKEIQEQIKDLKREAKDNGINTKALNLALKLRADDKIDAVTRDMTYCEANAILMEIGSNPVSIDLHPKELSKDF